MQHNSDTKTDGAKDWSEILARITSLENIVRSLQQELRNERAKNMNEKKVLQQQTEKLEARVCIMESWSVQYQRQTHLTQEKSAKKRKGKQNTTPVVNKHNTDDSESDTNVSTSSQPEIDLTPL